MYSFYAVHLDIFHLDYFVKAKIIKKSKNMWDTLIVIIEIIYQIRYK